MKVNPNYTQINAQAQLDDPGSVYHYYRELIALRKCYQVFIDGKYELLRPDDPNIFAYRRVGQQETLYVVCNFGAAEVKLPPELENVCRKRLIANYPQHETAVLRPFEAFMCLDDKRSPVGSVIG